MWVEPADGNAASAGGDHHDRRGANQFLKDRYIGEFNCMFSEPAAEKTTAFRKCRRKDLNQVFSIQTERTVANDNTVVICDRHWQLDRTQFRRPLAGWTVILASIRGGNAGPWKPVESKPGFHRLPPHQRRPLLLLNATGKTKEGDPRGLKP
jgi:hypothetical protein